MSVSVNLRPSSGAICCKHSLSSKYALGEHTPFGASSESRAAVQTWRSRVTALVTSLHAERSLIQQARSSAHAATVASDRIHPELRIVSDLQAQVEKNNKARCTRRRGAHSLRELAFARPGVLNAASSSPNLSLHTVTVPRCAAGASP